ncbi:hypothetical protein Pyn_21783 [Prunus yedoensis var. nudiflora]|uniref:Uncharacterized protein n=1 Tax=Prunus yedoensis var. nudiflora TaxID=2094558 RepID=A0A314YQ73_PRUYE|nr:hypothetical protein Pyn_21783 [Prunus yedoensis var. nudiflora]
MEEAADSVPSVLEPCGEFCDVLVIATYAFVGTLPKAETGEGGVEKVALGNAGKGKGKGFRVGGARTPTSP